jgi:hypothetical protein
MSKSRLFRLADRRHALERKALATWFDLQEASDLHPQAKTLVSEAHRRAQRAFKRTDAAYSKMAQRIIAESAAVQVLT